MKLITDPKQLIGKTISHFQEGHDNNIGIGFTDGTAVVISVTEEFDYPDLQLREYCEVGESDSPHLVNIYQLDKVGLADPVLIKKLREEEKAKQQAHKRAEYEKLKLEFEKEL